MRKVKRTLFLACVSVLCLSVNAQQQRNQEMGQRMAQMQQQRIEKLADDLNLKETARKNFITTYKAYQEELTKIRNAQFRNYQMMSDTVLTDEEANERIKAVFESRSQSLVYSYNALEVDKKYYEIFSKTLTPKQLVKIFAPSNSQFGNRGGMPQFDNSSMMQGRGNRNTGQQRGNQGNMPQRGNRNYGGQGGQGGFGGPGGQGGGFGGPGGQGGGFGGPGGQGGF